MIMSLLSSPTLTQKENPSRQDYETPEELIQAIKTRFGIFFVLDASASDENHKASEWYDIEDNALECDWVKDFPAITRKSFAAWLNPPFKHNAPWMKKCLEQSEAGAKIISLTLSSVGSNWYHDFIEGNALSLILRNRVQFVGQEQPYTKELMITLWGFGLTGLGFWNWKTTESKENN